MRPERESWGWGYGLGSHLRAAALDKRIAGAILTMPHIDGQFDYDNWPAEFRQYALSHRYNQKMSGQPSHIHIDVPDYFHFWPLDSAHGKAFLSGDFILAWAKGAEQLARAANNPFTNQVTTSSLWNTFKARPKDYLDRIERPVLWVVADDDHVTGPITAAKEAYGKIKGEKEMVVLNGDHLPAYFGREFDKGAKAMVDFVKRH